MPSADARLVSVYTLAELGQWVHLLAARAAAQAPGSEGRARDLRGAEFFLTAMRERVAALLSVDPEPAHDDDAPAHAEHTEARTDARTDAEPECPKCGNRMWDNRLSKRNAKAPDYKCRDRSCAGVWWPGQWPPKDGEQGALGIPDARPARRRTSMDAEHNG